MSTEAREAYRFALERALSYLSVKFRDADGSFLTGEEQQRAINAITVISETWSRGGDIRPSIYGLTELAWSLPPQSVTVVVAQLRALEEWSCEVQGDEDGTPDPEA